jgi:hypothetical protein
VKPKAYIRPERRDGKFPAVLVYPTNGTRLNKLLTRERALEIVRSGSYDIMTAPRELAEAK